MNITVTASPGDVDRQLARKAHISPSALREGLEELGEAGESVMHTLAPHGPSGNSTFDARITHSVEGAGLSQQVKIGSKSPHAHLVERGRRPGKMPPPAKMSALFGLDRHGGFVVARAIGAHGTTGHHVLERTRTALVDDVDRIARRVLEAVGDLHR